MLRIIRHGDELRVQDPVTGQWNDMINVVFMEEGRDGADKGMSDTTAFLTEIAGEQVGITQRRVHTHPVLRSAIANGKFAVDTTIPGHVNRELYTTAQMANQVGRPPRILNGRYTYFKTLISRVPEDDKDFRVPFEVQDNYVPQHLREQARIGVANVERHPNGNGNGGGAPSPAGAELARIPGRQ